MKLYDKIYTQPDESQEILGSAYALYSNDGEGEGNYLDDLHSLEGPVVVITMEELREVFNAGMNYIKEQSAANGVDFSAYMESKGIKI